MLKHRLKLLFVHVPKSGGTSVVQALQQQFGNRLYHDADGPGSPTSAMNIDPDGFLEQNFQSKFEYLDNIEAVTGHVWVRKYEAVHFDLRATILRHPVQRTISHYLFWRSPVTLAKHPLRKYLIDSDLDILGFARLPIIRWFYSRHMFRDTDMTIFDVLCDITDLRNDWPGVMRRLEIDSQPQHINKTSEHVRDYFTLYREISGNPVTMARLNDLLSDDIKFYEQALTRP